MNDLNALAFASLFKEAHQKCFGHSLTSPLTETESKLLSNQILEHTGLVIGTKSIKNYSFYISNSQGKQENPSIATLDTFARYVLDAPYTDEIQRKNKEAHYPYWFQYRNQFRKSVKKKFPIKSLIAIIIILVVLAVGVLLILSFPFQNQRQEKFTDDFHSLNEDSLGNRGWFVNSKEAEYWKRRNENRGYLSLFTLRGDNWPDSSSTPVIKNLLVRKINADCFTAEVHLKEFFPQQNWQQAGILIMEDTNFVGKSLRLSIMYNDFYGGFPKSKEIIIQAITSLGKNFDKPEEIAHQVIFTIDSAQEKLVALNLQNSALRVEKKDKQFKLLYASSSMANSAFKELAIHEFNMKPKYVGLFALKGFVDSSQNMPARFNFFSLINNPCEQ